MRKGKKRTILAVDIGNTATSYGLFMGGRLRKRLTVPTRALNRRQLRPFEKWGRQADEAVICSVVPEATQAVRRILKKHWGLKTVVLGKDRKVGVKVHSPKPQQAGTDRLVNALSASKIVRADCIVVDFGTAVTFDVVSKLGAYEGGVIAPGIQMTLNALAEHTALVPKISLKHIGHVIGKSTVTSVRSGCAHGLGALCDGMIERIDRERGLKHRVIATGGQANFMKRYTSRITRVYPNLTLQGIYWSTQK